ANSPSPSATPLTARLPLPSEPAGVRAVARQRGHRCEAQAADHTPPLPYRPLAASIGPLSRDGGTARRAEAAVGQEIEGAELNPALRAHQRRLGDDFRVVDLFPAGAGSRGAAGGVLGIFAVSPLIIGSAIGTAGLEVAVVPSVIRGAAPLAVPGDPVA